jgi:uncharacterized membrane protein YbhN (UPF0104 family)
VGVGCIFAAVSLSFVRWHWLVRALELKFRLLDALRLGAIGFVLNFVALGNVGGDLFKAIFIARDQPGRRTEAVATVVVDRVVGLFTMLVLASTAVLVMGLDRTSSTAVILLCRVTVGCTVVACAGLAVVLFLPGITGDRVVRLAGRIPLAGPIAVQLISALQAYRSRKRMLLWAFLLSVVVDTFFIVSFYFIGRGLPVRAPTMAEHFFIVPLSVAAGAIPITPSGFGTLEAAMEALYQAVPSGATVTPGDGTIVTLAHRVGMMIVAAIGLLFYITQRAELRKEVESVEWGARSA